MKKILLIEDDKDFGVALAFDLKVERYKVFPAYTLREGRQIYENERVDLILLDGSLPDGDGFSFCREVKAECDIPVIFLTARDMEQDEMRGFDCGADDYITKPFKTPILHRRIQAALRRAGGERMRNRYEDGYLKIDFDSFEAMRGNEALALTPTEYKILRLLTANADKVMTKQLLLEKIWDPSGNFVDEHTVAVNINRLRKKIETDGHMYIKTMYGMGYRWNGKGGQ